MVTCVGMPLIVLGRNGNDRCGMEPGYAVTFPGSRSQTLLPVARISNTSTTGRTIVGIFCNEEGSGIDLGSRKLLCSQRKVYELEFGIGPFLPEGGM